MLKIIGFLVVAGFILWLVYHAVLALGVRLGTVQYCTEFIRCY